MAKIWHARQGTPKEMLQLIGRKPRWSSRDDPVIQAKVYFMEGFEGNLTARIFGERRHGEMRYYPQIDDDAAETGISLDPGVKYLKTAKGWLTDHLRMYLKAECDLDRYIEIRDEPRKRGGIKGND